MRKLKGKQLVMVLLLVIGVIGIGGKIMLDKREERKEQELLAVEKQSVKVLKNTFANIAEVDIERTGYNSMTGSYRMLVTMTNKEDKKVSFSYGFIKNNNEIDTYVLKDREIQKKGITNDKIKIIYSNGEEGEI